MFAQSLIYIFILLVFAWAVWKMIIKPILKSKGIEVEEVEDIKTAHTKKLEKLKAEAKATQASTKAAEESVEVIKDIKWMEEKIDAAENKIKEMN